MRRLQSALKRRLGARGLDLAPREESEFAPPDEDLRRAYLGFAVRTIDYARVRDFSDSLQRLNRLATQQGDLKDAQRPWMVKALWSLLPDGGRVIEVGGGQPYVADVLSRTGYDVTIVDPYDGSANGPREYEMYRENYPNVSFVRATFDADISRRLPVSSYDAVFSISVLEHLQPKEIRSVITGAKSLLRADGWSVHNVDHVMNGRDQRQSLERLGALAQLHGVGAHELRQLLQTADTDAETYFLSAESHERWRKFLGLSYEEYPMQRVVSISVAARRDELEVTT